MEFGDEAPTGHGTALRVSLPEMLDRMSPDS